MALDPGVAARVPATQPQVALEMQSAFDQLALMKTARQQDRDDLQQIVDANIGQTAAAILAFNQARLSARLTDTNVDVDSPLDDEEEPAYPPTQPASESTS